MHQLVEATRECVAGYVVPGERTPRSVKFTPGTITKVKTDVFAALRAKKNSPVERWLETGVLRLVSGNTAQRKHDGESSFVIDEKPPLQAAAEVYGETKDPEAALAAAEIKEPPMPGNRNRNRNG